MRGCQPYGNFARTASGQLKKESEWMGLRPTRISPLASRTPSYASCILRGEVHATSTRPFSGGQNRPDSKCRRNGKVLTRKTSWNPRLRDAAATKVGVVARMTAELFSNYYRSTPAFHYSNFRGITLRSRNRSRTVNCYVNVGFHLRSSQMRTFIPRKHSCVQRITFYNLWSVLIGVRFMWPWVWLQNRFQFPPEGACWLRG